MVVSAVFVIDGASDKTDKFLSDGVSHEVAYVHDRRVILSAEPFFSDTLLFSAYIPGVTSGDFLSRAEVLP